MPSIRRYGPALVTPQVSPRAELGRGREQTFAAFQDILGSANDFIRPAVEQVQTARGEQEALAAVDERGPQWGLRQLQGSSSTITIGESLRNRAMREGGGPTNEAVNAWLRYDNQNATRNKPISSKLEAALSFLPDMGISMEVYSGGQDAKGTGNRRTGSVRHDHGNAADVRFYKDGRLLSWENPGDIPLYQEIVRRARQNGVTGFGAGPGYMEPGAMHIGFGNPAVWGAGGKGENAPDWLRQAFGGVTDGETGQVRVPGVGGAVTVTGPGTPEDELETLNSSTFEPRMPFTVRDAAFNRAADRVITARAQSALEEGMRAAMQRADGDIGKLREEMESVRAQVMSELPQEMPGLATELQAQFDRGRIAAERQAIELSQRRVMARQEEALGQIVTTTRSEAGDWR